jgi:HPt (histidine-containing phosphotransfer) domain-containing protein
MRARERGRNHTPIVAMTSTTTAEERRRCTDAGMDGYLGKPLDLGQLTSLVERFTQLADGQQPDAPEDEPETPVAEEAPSDPAAGLQLTDSQGAAQPRPALDTARLEESCMGIPALRDTLLRAFLDEVKPRMERMRQAVQVRDIRQVEFEAHGLKGMSATIGAAGCAEVFNRMELRSREGEVDGIVEWLSQAEQEVDRVMDFIRKYEEVLRRAA